MLLCARRLTTAGVRASQALSSRYNFIPAAVADKPEIMQFTLDYFLSTEPHCRAFGITKSNGYEFVEGVVSMSLECNLSMRVVDKATDKLIGVRLVTERARGAYNGHAEGDEGVNMMTAILDQLKADFWRLRPEANKVILREITCVHPAHQRQGIAQHIVDLGIDHDQLRAAAIDGIMSEASSAANQTLLERNGYREITRSREEQYIRSNGDRVVLPDGTKSLKLLYLSLRKEERSS